MKSINPPGIFNDALGPVMRGPSSSHTAGSYRIGCVLRQLAQDQIKEVTFRFHATGSLATTYHTQGSDIGLAAGIIGMQMTDRDMPNALKLAAKAGINLSFVIDDYPADHPNTYVCHLLTLSGDSIELTAISTGGGLIEVVNFQGFDCSLPMDLPVLFTQGESHLVEAWLTILASDSTFQNLLYKQKKIEKDSQCLVIHEFSELTEPKNLTRDDRLDSILIEPVYPVLGYTGSPLPFLSASDIEKRSDFMNGDLSKLAISYESARSGLSDQEVVRRMDQQIELMQQSIETGLAGTTYDDRIIQAQAPQFNQHHLDKALLPAGPLSKISTYIMAIMEAKSAMEVIIAAPTAGAAGGLPGTLIAMSEEIGASRDSLTRAFLAAGLIGVFINRDATFAAEVAGCQAETGAGAAMAAAGLVQLAGGTARQALGAASIAMQNVMGLICDPVGNRVEIPCLSRNVQAGANALSSANLILGGVDPIIPLSETIQTMLSVGKALPRELRCTALGGLAVTPTAKQIENNLKKPN